MKKRKKNQAGIFLLIIALIVSTMIASIGKRVYADEIDTDPPIVSENQRHVKAVQTSKIRISMKNSGKYSIQLRDDERHNLYYNVFRSNISGEDQVSTPSNIDIKYGNTTKSWYDLPMKELSIENGNVIKMIREEAGVARYTLRLSIIKPTSQGSYMKVEMEMQNIANKVQELGTFIYWNMGLGNSMESHFEFIENGWRNKYDRWEVFAFFKDTPDVTNADGIWAGKHDGRYTGWNHRKEYRMSWSDHKAKIGGTVSALNADVASGAWYDPIPVQPGESRKISTIVGIGPEKVPVVPEDIIKPTIPVVRFHHGYESDTWSTKDITFTVSDSMDNVGIKNYEHSIDNGVLWITGDTGTLTQSGIYQIVGRALDTAGNPSDNSEIKIVKIDKVLPEAFTPNVVADSTTAITISGTTSDSGSGLAALPYSFYNGSVWGDDVADTSKTFTGYTPNAQVTLQMRAKDAVGNMRTSSELPIYTKADTPDLIEAEPNQDGHVVLTLDKKNNPNDTQYYVEKSLHSDFSQVTMGADWESLKEGNTITITGLTPATTYYFRTKARNGDHIETEYSNSKHTTTVLSGSEPPTVSVISSSSIKVSWADKAGAMAYKVYRDGEAIARTETTQYTDTALLANKAYSYAVSAVNESGESKKSEGVLARTWAEYPNSTTIINTTSTTVKIELEPPVHIGDNQKYQLTLKKAIDDTIVSSHEWSTDSVDSFIGLDNTIAYKLEVDVKNDENLSRGPKVVLPSFYINRQIEGELTTRSDGRKSEVAGYNQFTLKAKVYDPDGGKAIVKATLDGKTLTQVIDDVPTTVPNEDNITLTWDISDISEGTYTDIEILLEDDSDTSRTLTYAYTLMVDKTPPVITLNGDKMLTVEENDFYEELGATVEGDDGNGIIITGQVDATRPGAYSITYTSTDYVGNKTTETRNVVIVGPEDSNIPSFFFNPSAYTVLEEDSSVTITVQRMGGMTTEASITLSLDGSSTATRDEDYELTLETLYFEAGEGSKTVHIRLINDDIYEVDETIILKLEDPRYGDSSEIGRVVGEAAVVTIISDDPKPQPQDDTPPSITLLGNQVVTIEQGETYVESGYTAVDDRDGDITNQVRIIGTVDTDTIGSYILTYSVTDEAGNETTVTRTINIIKKADNPRYTLIYDANGGVGTVPMDSTNYIGGATATVLGKSSLIREDYTFTGWNTQADGKGKNYKASDTFKIDKHTTLYAQWVQKAFSIKGNVIDEDGVGVSSATVKLMAGSRKIAEVTTDNEGTFTLTGVPAGTYNLVIIKGDQTVTQVITVSTGDVTIRTIKLPKGNINSIVDVKPNTPDIVVDQLNTFFESSQFTQDDKNVVDSGGTVEIKLVVEKKDESGDNAAANVEAIKAVAANKKEIGIFLDLAISKFVKPADSQEREPVRLNELENVLILNIPLPEALQGKNNYVIYRYHGSEVQEINERPNSGGEYIEVSGDKKSIILHTKKFSTYAIAYDPAIIPDNGGSGGNSDVSSSNSGGGGSSSKLPTITTEIQDGGKITISQDKKEATITPNEGYVIADVIVNGKSIGARTKYTFTNNGNHKIQAVFVKKTALPYYMEDGKRVYIGFSAIAADHYDYIAPAGEIIEFRDNPKDFIDNTIPWAKPSIDFVTERELFFGTSENMFSPNETMTRAMFVTVIGRLYERSYGHIIGENTFVDVDQEAYYAKYVGWANDHGIIKGIGENKFAPEAMVTREQMGAIMRNFAEFLNKADVPDRALAYTDSTQISPWAIQGAKYCQETGVITGRDGRNFVPKGNATRAEVAAVVERFIKVIVK